MDAHDLIEAAVRQDAAGGQVGVLERQVGQAQRAVLFRARSMRPAYGSMPRTPKPASARTAAEVAGPAADLEHADIVTGRAIGQRGLHPAQHFLLERAVRAEALEDVVVDDAVADRHRAVEAPLHGVEQRAHDAVIVPALVGLGSGEHLVSVVH